MTKLRGVLMRRVSTRIVLAVLVCTTGISLAEGPEYLGREYAVTDLGTLPGDTYSEGISINVWGHVVGCSGTPVYACNPAANSTGGFLWTGQKGIQALKPLSGTTTTYPVGINDLSQIAGTSFASNGATVAVVWSKDGSVRDLGTLNKNCENICYSGVVGISDSGVVAGSSQVSQNGSWDPFVWTDDSGMVNLESVYPLSTPEAINVFGGIAGQSDVGGYALASLWRPRTGVENLGALPGGDYSLALAINNLFQVVGYSAFPGGDDHYFHAFLWTKDVGMQDLGTLAPSPSTSEAFGINDLGDVVGYTQYNQYAEFHAFVWSHQRGMQDLNNLIDPNSGWVLNSANAINILGQITGSGTINGQTHAFLLTPRRR
jgi:probable HAF family extracellular repeat protein